MDNIIQIDTEMICETAQQLIEEVYDTFNQQCTNPHYFKNRAIVAETNSDVKELNESLLHQVPGETQTYLSIDSCIDPDDAAYVGTEVLNNIENGEKVINPLWTAVTSFMLHGPCGQYNPSLGCMVDGCCRFGYPKNYQATTEISEDSYPQY